MKLIHKLVIAGALTVPMLAPAARAQEFFGDWDTNQGVMHIEQEGDHVRGDYALRDGRFHGEIRRDGLSGTWAQSFSDRRCFEERMGSNYWGRFRLHLSDDGEYFHGRWSYCNDDPGSGGEWTGHRHHHHHHWDHP